MVRASACTISVNRYHVERRARDPNARRSHYACVEANRLRLIDEMNKLKSGPCPDCKLQFNPWQMQFDHVRGEKVADVSKLADRGSTRKFWEEVAKCEVVCACCHADRTHKRKLNKGP